MSIFSRLAANKQSSPKSAILILQSLDLDILHIITSAFFFGIYETLIVTRLVALQECEPI